MDLRVMGADLRLEISHEREHRAQAARHVNASEAKTLLILGASGDLTSRLLLPGLGGLLATGDVRCLKLIGSARADWNDEKWFQIIADSFAAVDARGKQVDALVSSARYIKADVSTGNDLRRLLDACDGVPILYFALPPAVTIAACRTLGELGVPDGTRLVVEKPFGTDAASAQSFNKLLAELVPEDQTFRVDHYLGMSTVLNILGLRFANRIWETVLNADHVARIEVNLDECLALEGRAGYYDKAGALVDMLQSHALEVLALLTMDAPPTLSARDVRDRIAQLIRAVHLRNDDPVSSSQRARYTAGEIDGRVLPSYVDEQGVDPSRMTETFAQVELEIRNWRWAGVPITMRAGKALDTLRKEVVITFKAPPCVPVGLTGYEFADRLRIGLDPDRMELRLNVNGSDDPTTLDPIQLGADLGPGRLPPYGQVLEAILNGNPILSVRGDTVVDCWRIIDPVRRAWREGKVPMGEYAAGSSPPPERRRAR
ncbi:MAG TPA: glucose-6-phosphate dehydrogenase [Gemmatimonadaceae bacterium]|nr:glucose-6-phosphate dehydrogenase [Gemmatimonadaceae bacterium]